MGNKSSKKKKKEREKKLKAQQQMQQQQNFNQNQNQNQNPQYNPFMNNQQPNYDPGYVNPQYAQQFMAQGQMSQGQQQQFQQNQQNQCIANNLMQQHFNQGGNMQNMVQQQNYQGKPFNPYGPEDVYDIQVKTNQKLYAKQGMGLLTGLDMENMYLFGLNNNNESKIIQFNPTSKNLTSLVIPPEMKVLNYMLAIYINETTIYVTGGITRNLNDITKAAYIFNPKACLCQKLPDMIQERYTHFGLVLDDKLYNFGGRQFGKGKVGILKACEYFDFNSWRWFEMCPMQKRRCTGNSLVYGGEIYVFGGYTGDKKRDRMVEKYEIETDSWIAMEFEIPQGIEASIIIPSVPNEILIIGGTKQDGKTPDVYNLNLKNLTLGSFPAMREKRCLHKGWKHQGKIWIFGGEDKDTVESFDFAMHMQHKHEKWQLEPINYKQMMNAEKGMKQWSHSHPSHVMQFSEDYQQYQEIVNPDYVLFGIDNERKIIKIKVTNNQYKMEAMDPPLSLLLLGYMGGCKLGPNIYFLAGGLASTLKRITRDCYIYNVETNTVEKKEMMWDKRYTFPMVYLHPYVYAIGGRQYGSQQTSILRSCERFNLETNQWERIGSMFERRCTAQITVFQGQLYVVGGFQIPNKRVGLIERFNINTNKFDGMNFKLSIPLEAGACVQVSYHQFIFLGGKSQTGSEKKVYSLDFMNQGNNFCKNIGTLREKKALHKAIYLGGTQIVVFGGDSYPIEVFDYQTGKNVTNHPCINVFRCAINDLGINKLFKKYLII